MINNVWYLIKMTQQFGEGTMLELPNGSHNNDHLFLSEFLIEVSMILFIRRIIVLVMNPLFKYREVDILVCGFIVYKEYSTNYSFNVNRISKDWLKTKTMTSQSCRLFISWHHYFNFWYDINAIVNELPKQFDFMIDESGSLNNVF